MVKLFSFLISETMRENPSVILTYKKIIQDTYEKEKSLLIKKMKRFGPDSYLWGNTHTITCPQNLEIGENVHIGNNCYIRADGGVTIGDNTHISRNLVLYSINHNYTGMNLPYDESYIHKPVIIGKNVWIGMNVCITPGTIIGDGTIIGMGTTVSGRVPPLAIIGSQTWRVIGRRNEAHYESLNKLGRYGAINGKLHIDVNKQLHKIGDRINSRRSFSEVVGYNGGLAVKKTFLDTAEGLNSFETEKLAANIFHNYKWFPKIYETTSNSIVYEYLKNDTRLDTSIKEYTNKEKNEILKDVLCILLDIFSHDIAHRDFHGGNIFYSKDTGIKLIDYETIISTTGTKKDFFNSYDIIGEGFESPYYTNNMCFFKKHKRSLGNLFQINDIDQLKKITEGILIDKLYAVSSSFYTKRYKDRDRHYLKNSYIYNTFDMPYLKVDHKIAQRNIKSRLKKFGVSKKMISGKKVLDIGSNIGGILFELFKMQPAKAVGLEYDKEKIDISKLITKIHAYENIDFYQMDIESSSFIEDFSQKYDIIFCLAIIEHLRDKEVFINKLARICDGYLFFEGNNGTDIKKVKDSLENAGFGMVNYIGLSDDEKDKSNNTRPLYICHI